MVTTAQAIRAFLAERGGVMEAPEGNAGRMLADALDRPYDTVATTLARLEKRGQIARDTQGRRTFAIRLLDRPEPEITPETLADIPEHNRVLEPTDGTDYDTLAGSILRRIVHIEASRGRETETFRSLRDRLEDCHASLRREQTEKARLARWRAEAEPRLETLERELQEVRQRAQAAENELRLRRRHNISEFLNESERKALEKMIRERPVLGDGDDDA